uniref:(northern house mosquito) hypothetical protein n=1 Tax=Culex pipiens TaxID=7175 RepID=A0A8D8HD67_CULPI
MPAGALTRTATKRAEHEPSTPNQTAKSTPRASARCASVHRASTATRSTPTGARRASVATPARRSAARAAKSASSSRSSASRCRVPRCRSACPSAIPSVRRDSR